MTAQTGKSVDRRQIAVKIAPFIIVALAGMAVRTLLAAAYPIVALFLFLWVVADTLMLSLIARSSGKPEWSAVLALQLRI